jgi:L-ascorbate metabolism protein UlaG (beta-lactamase superfamily)
MRLTKYEHACFTVEKDDQIIVIDPGGFSTDFIAPEHVVAVVITHEHGDHLDHDQIAAIVDKNPEALIIGPEAVVANIEVFQTKAVHAGDTISVGAFALEFFGGEHAVIHDSIPPVANLGVLVNDLLYYPGDSFTLPDRPIDTLAIPASAPWMKIGEAMDFLAHVLPRFAFPTHDAILSAEGKEITDRLLGMTAKKNTLEYRRLEQPVDI